jgi:plastocyanin
MFKDGGELQSANVTIYQGGTVTWKNSDSQVHNIVPAELFDFRGTGDIEPSASSRAVLFNGLGTKAWYCTKHPDEKGTITVVEEEKQQPEDQQPEDQQP